MNVRDNFITILGPLYRFLVLNLIDILSGTKVYSSYKLIKKLSKYSKPELQEWQFNECKKVLEHFYNNSPYYRSKLESLNITPSDIKTLDDMKKLPVLTKLELIQNYDNALPVNYTKYGFIINSTGGSTGNPLKFHLDKKSLSYNIANNIFYWEKTGLKYGFNHVAFGSASLKVGAKIPLKAKVFNFLRGRIPINGINMSNEELAKKTKIIKDKNIRFLYGYSSTIFLLAKYCLANNISLDIKCCYTTSEVLTPHYKEVIEKAFNCKVVNCYGARDGGIMAYEIEGVGLEVGYACIVDSDDNSKMSEVNTTDLFNYTFPFIKYQVGDMVSFSTSNDSLFNGQLLDEIGGRASDIMQLENGSVLTGPGFTVLFKDLPVLGYQIKKNGINSIDVKVVKMEGYSPDTEAVILSTMQKQAGVGSNVTVTLVDEISKNKNGKSEYFLI